MSLLNLDGYNKSILAIPAYFFMTWFPHAYAISVASAGNPLTYDNRNPRAIGLVENLKKKLSQDDFRKWERARAAHTNGMENLPLFAAAMIIGNIAKLPQKDLDWAAGTYLAIRAIYFIQYIANKRQSFTFFRSVLWAGSVAICFRVIFAASRSLSSPI